MERNIRKQPTPSKREVGQMYKGLLAAVEHQYAIWIKSCEVIHDTARTIVYKITAAQGTFILKSIFTHEFRLQTILEAEAFLRRRGIQIPFTIPTKDNMLYFSFKRQLFVMQQWICGRHYQLTCLDDAVQLSTLLGRTHAASKDYRDSLSGYMFCGAAVWGQEYNKVLDYFEQWKNDTDPIQNTWQSVVMSYLDFFIAAGNEVKQRATTNPIFLSWKDDYQSLVLSHSDFHTQNILMDEEGELYIIDWEFVRLDFPSRDINRLLYTMLKKSTAWHGHLYTKVMTVYLKENQLSEPELRLLQLDLAFPHNLFRNLLWNKFERMSTRQLNAFLKKEQDKTVYLLNRVR
jgi:CotS family spore coat protein